MGCFGSEWPFFFRTLYFSIKIQKYMEGRTEKLLEQRSYRLKLKTITYYSTFTTCNALFFFLRPFKTWSSFFLGAVHFSPAEFTDLCFSPQTVGQFFHGIYFFYNVHPLPRSRRVTFQPVPWDGLSALPEPDQIFAALFYWTTLNCTGAQGPPTESHETNTLSTFHQSAL